MYTATNMMGGNHNTRTLKWLLTRSTHGSRILPIKSWL